MSNFSQKTRRASLHGPEIEHCLNVIQSTYGHTADVQQKGKSLNKFGRTNNADAGVRTTVGTFGSVATINVNETLATTNAIDTVSSSSASDTEVLSLEGHTIDASGNLTFVVQDVTLTGQTVVTLDTPLARANRLYVKDGTFASPSSDLVGDVYVFESGGTVTSGVPQTSADVHLRIVAGKNQTEKCATAISSTDYWIISGVTVSMARTGGSTVAVDFELEVCGRGGVWRPLGATIDVSKNAPFAAVSFSPHRIIRPNSDVRMVATSTAADTIVSAEIEGYLASFADA